MRYRLAALVAAIAIAATACFASPITDIPANQPDRNDNPNGCHKVTVVVPFAGPTEYVDNNRGDRFHNIFDCLTDFNPIFRG